MISDHNPVCASYPVYYTNNPFVIGQIDNMVCINNAIEVDLFGQVASEALPGGISQVLRTADLFFGSYKSKGNRLYCPDLYCQGQDGELQSRIIPVYCRNQLLHPDPAFTLLLNTARQLKGLST